MFLTRISLAAKYRILFGCAVVLIIGAALWAPWYRMELLVQDQAFQEARRVTEDFFRLQMPDPSATVPSPGVHAEGLGINTHLPHQPRFDRLDLTPEDESNQTTTADAPSFVDDALAGFQKHTKRDFTYRIHRRDDGRWLQYAHAVRVTRRCLDCHDEGKTAVPYKENQLAGLITVEVPADPAGQGVLINRLVIITAGVLATPLAILVFYVITKRFILGPVNELRNVALRVADGDLETRADLHTGDEFEQLADNLNTMLERLRDSQEDLKRANRLLDEKLGHMAESNVALYEANRIKSEFLANVSHELRTPLTSIIGFAELLRESPRKDNGERIERYSENILISGRILLEIINDLLDLAKIEAGKVEIHVDNIQLDELCAALIDFTRPLADKKKLNVTLHADRSLPTLATDAGKVRQILFNLMSNAIKFTPEKGKITLTARQIGEHHVRVAVTDNGPGIQAEDQSLIFEKFRQIDQSETREHHGTGLGLAIARELTHLLGGTIGVDSQPGQGATFWIELPTTAPKTQHRAPVSLI